MKYLANIYEILINIQILKPTLIPIPVRVKKS